DRRNYQQADNINFKDGDIESSIYFTDPEKTEAMYANSGETFSTYMTLINDHARVYKGASWADRIYWANPGTRRYLNERQSTATIGFRCSMTRVGSPVGLGDEKRRSKLNK
ncbi:MAG: gliding motility lipoprotein GldJ, partial [Flavobacteriales bacterium]|nr:gliding motility lipoprotein GldJ [Flavobacteriales bacterium]